MSKKKNSRRTIRKFGSNRERSLVCLYGKMFPIRFIKAYCNLHQCYLSAENITEKSCNKKHCIYLKEINSNDQPR